MNLILDVAITVAAVSIIVAFYKHKTLKNVVASAKKEISYLEYLGTKISSEAKTDYANVIARLKSIF